MVNLNIVIERIENGWLIKHRMFYKEYKYYCKTESEVNKKIQVVINAYAKFVNKKFKKSG